MGLIPDEAKGLPPPGIMNYNSAWMALMGWCVVMIDNAVKLRPPIRSGVHRQVLGATVGWFIGYHLTKYANYKWAKRDQEMLAYMKFHPEDFQKKEKKTYAEIVEPFKPVF
ncbi:NADH dehydrogenase [ubiquinone] 1 subunit C2 [Cynoglossus semilaevis]|uniref:NADH dehydrogenase [ubiquinone] 1 subunit C2 n=1 Tax=Cynoglossus semilaevis TaxID=244447 RepID=A0A3P8VA56_CYNSE|nr:NADH dehydrogenase [ubiquinone] 1 subunit C2-like [Cynoglossus semilaevis]